MAVSFEDLIGGGGTTLDPSDPPIDGEVANYSALPSAATVSGQTYRVLAEQGTWFLGTLKRAGDYYSNGVSWTHLGESSYLVKAHDTSVTDNALVKYHSTDGQSIQESGVIVDDSNNVTGIVNITTTGTSAILGNFSFEANQTVGAGQDNYVLTYDHGDGKISLETSAGGNSFQTIAVSGQSDVVADSASDTLTLVAGTNITITTNAGTDTITINSTGGSGTFDYGMAYVISSGQFSS